MSGKCDIGQFAAGLGLASAMTLGLLGASPAASQEVKIGVLFDVSGPVAGFVPPILDAVNLAVEEVNANGGILKGQTLKVVVRDTHGTTEGAIEAANKLVKDDKVAAIVGALMSSTTIAAAREVAIPNRIVLISPSATTPQLTTLDDDGFVFRTIQSDAYQGWMLGQLVYQKGLRAVALTYVDNDYGRGIADTFRASFENLGGTVTYALAHEPGKSSYLTQLRTLTAGKPQALVIVAFAASSGITIIKEALERGLFKQFIGTDALRDILLIQQFGADKLKGIFFTAPVPAPGTAALDRFSERYAATYNTSAEKPYVTNAYDATMLLALAIERAGSVDRTKIRDALRMVAVAPGEPMEPGDWAKAKAAIDAGQDINYFGASGPLEFDDAGDIAGVIGEFVIENGTFKEVGLVTP